MKDSQQLSFDIRLTRKDIQHLNLQHQKKSLVISFFVYWLLFAVIVMARSTPLDELTVTVAVLGGAGISALISGLMYLFVAFRSNRMYQSDALLQHNHSYTFSDTGISTASDSGAYHINWKEIFKVTESKFLICIYVGSNRALLLPKATITNQLPPGVAALKSILNDNVAKDKLKLRKAS
ncbi:YcxB family protein [Paenibacillus gorillae]|uniref:YcxB family protein n=1 Tax=Paenibacillus gorillae TaxID=1243662 RepID=UPI0005AA4D0F|nr:YcxB family protein [Paenibacillus gorillae]